MRRRIAAKRRGREIRGALPTNLAAAHRNGRKQDYFCWIGGAVFSAGAAVGVAAIGVATLPLSGCAKFDAAMSQQEAVVTFTAGTTQATMLKVRDACGKVAGATPEAIPTSINGTSGTYDVRFRVDQASDADIARLSKCLSQFKSVQGINLEQQDGS